MTGPGCAVNKNIYSVVVEMVKFLQKLIVSKIQPVVNYRLFCSKCNWRPGATLSFSATPKRVFCGLIRTTRLKGEEKGILLTNIKGCKFSVLMKMILRAKRGFRSRIIFFERLVLLCSEVICRHCALSFFRRMIFTAKRSFIGGSIVRRGRHYM